MKAAVLFLAFFPAFLWTQNDCVINFDNPGEDCAVVLDTSNTGNIWQIGKPDNPVFSSASTPPNAIVTDTSESYPPSTL